MDIAKEDLKFDKEGNAVYTLQIKDFHNKMKSWEAGKHIDSKHFKFQDVELFLRVYPNGYEAEMKGYVSVYLRNATKKQVFTSFKFRIGGRELSNDIDLVPPELGLGWSLQHSSLVNQKGDAQLEVICTIMKLKCLETEGTYDTIENINKDVERLNDSMKGTNVKLAQLESKYTASQEETNMKLTKIEAKIDELEKGRKTKKPTCPICFEEMLPDAKIAQCISGHLICWSCKEKMVKNDCPSCGQPVNGRAFGMEIYLKYLFQD